MAEKSLYELLKKIVEKTAFSAVTATSNSETAVDLTSGTITACYLNSWSGASGANQSDFSLSDGGLKCNFNGLAEVSGSVYVGGGAGAKGCYIYKNDEEVAATSHGTDSSGRSVAPKIISVSNGDVLYLKGRATSTGSKMYQNNASTYLTVKRVG